MKVELVRVEGAPEKYKVLVGEDDAPVPTMQIGTTVRLTDSTWSFSFAPHGVASSDDAQGFTLAASDTDELKRVIQARFGLLDLPADRLLDATMEGFATSVLAPLSRLATSTQSIAGFTKALAHHLAAIASQDVQADRREQFFEVVFARVREEAKATTAETTRLAALSETLRDLFTQAAVRTSSGGGDDPVKH